MQNSNTHLKNPYPAIDLRRAYDHLLKLRTNFPKKDALGRQELLVDGLGFSETSSTGHNIVGALSHYGLLHRNTIRGQTSYRITQEALELVAAEADKEKWAILAHRAATRPILFHFLASEYPDNKLPVGLEGRLIRKYGEVTPKNVGAIIYRYKESLKFADSNLHGEEKEEVAYTGAESNNSPRTRELMDFPIPLSDGTLVTVNMPKMISKKDADRITRFIETLSVEELANE